MNVLLAFTRYHVILTFFCESENEMLGFFSTELFNRVYIINFLVVLNFK